MDEKVEEILEKPMKDLKRDCTIEIKEQRRRSKSDK